MEPWNRDIGAETRPARARGPGLPRLAALGAVLALGGVIATSVLGDDRPAAGPTAGDAVEPEAVALHEPPTPAVIALPLDRIDGLAVLGEATACVRGGRALACTADGGDSWVPFGELPDRILAVVQQEGEVRAATADGTVWAIFPGRAPEVRSEPPAELGVVDAAARGPEVFLLAHRYDRPTDPMKLPRVVNTAVLVLGEGGRLESRGSLPGWAGDRLLVQPGGEVTVWAPFDSRAYRSRDGGRTFAPVPRTERLGAEFGGLLATIERRIEPKRQGRPARSISTLLLSRDGGGTWDIALEAEGELVVQFSGPTDGLAVARSEGAIYRTGARGELAPALADDRLADAVDAARLGRRWLVVTSTGLAFRIP